MLKIGDILQGRYRILREIGTGGIGVIFLAEDLNLKKYAVVKKIRENFVDRLETRSEVDILKKLHHMYLPQVYDFFQNGREVYTVMDYIEGQDMQHHLEQRLEAPEQSVCRWLNQLLEVLQYLHAQKPPIYHSDIKPANIMITPAGDVCLIDFNISLGDNEKTLKGLSKWYSAPEQRRAAVNPGTAAALDERMDLYSLGASFYSLMTFCYPNPDEESKWTQESRQRYSDGLIEIISKSMRQDRRRRFSDAQQMQKALENLQRWDHTQRRFWYLRLGCCSISAILVTCGISMMLYGGHRKRVEAWQTKLERFLEECPDLMHEEAAVLGRQLSESREAKKYMTPQEHGLLLRSLGDVCSFEEAYGEAAQYYAEADRYTDDLQLDLDYAVALVRDGRIEEAKTFVSGRTEEEFRLLEGEIFLKERDFDDAVKTADELAGRTGNTQLRFRACVLAADAYREAGKKKEELGWLLKADIWQSDHAVMRRIMAVSSELYSMTKEEKYLDSALSYGEEICEKWQFSANDRLNLALVEISGNRYDEAFDRLSALEREDTGMYQVPMYLAILSWKKEPGSAAFLSYCEEAQALYEADAYAGTDEQMEELMREYRKRRGL